MAGSAEDRREARYDAFADWYQDFAPDRYEDTVSATLLDLVGDVRARKILDLACGHGRFARELARRGATVTGLDLSRKLLERAEALELQEPLGIDYRYGDASSPDTLAGETFDAVVCSFGLTDIDDLDGTLSTVARVLPAGGEFVFSMVHPCFPGVEERQAEPSWSPRDGYFAEGWRRTRSPASGLRARVGSNHRMLSTYINALIASGLHIVELAEPAPSPEEPPTKVPIYLVGRCRKAGLS